MYSKLRSKMNQSITDVKDQFVGGRTSRDNSMLNQSMPDQMGLASSRLGQNKKPRFIPGVSAVEGDDDEDVEIVRVNDSQYAHPGRFSDLTSANQFRSQALNQTVIVQQTDRVFQTPPNLQEQSEQSDIRIEITKQ